MLISIDIGSTWTKGALFSVRDGLLSLERREATATTSEDLSLSFNDILKRLKLTAYGQTPILCAGNRDLQDSIKEIFKSKDLLICSNVLPELDNPSPEEARDMVREAFMTKIIQGKVIRKGIREPRVKRSVEGDLGMRVSALSALGVKESQLSGEIGKRDLSWNVFKQYAKKVNKNTDFIPQSETEKQFDFYRDQYYLIPLLANAARVYPKEAAASLRPNLKKSGNP